MILYQFRTEDGETVERFFPMGGCPAEIEVGGRTARRVFGAPAVHVQGAPVKDRDGLRMEVEAEARDAGIRQLIPMKGQPLERQLADLKANKEKFREEMGAANQKSREKARGKTALPQPTEKQCAEHAEKQQKKAYQERRIRL